MWISASFASMPDVVQFLNDRRLAAATFQIVVARDDENNQLFHVVYEVAQDREAIGLAVQEAELLPVVEGAAEEETAATLEAVEDFLHQRTEHDDEG